MPLYEYHCDRCGNFEVIRKFSDAPLAACPTCEGAIEKLISSPAVHFKGGGWYVTDYAKKSSDDTAKKAADSPGSSKGTDSAKGGEASKGADTPKTTPAPAASSSKDTAGSSTGGSSTT